MSRSGTTGRGDPVAVWLLAVGQTLTYAALYYSFAALLPDLEAATGWSKAQLAVGPTVAFLVTAALTPVTGRLVDRGWGGELLIGMPVLGAVALLGLGFVTTPLGWTGLWAMIGVAQAGAVYETCFAFLTRRLGGEARAAIIRITLVAGFASTLAFPLGDLLGRQFGGQGALVAFAALAAVGVLPVNAIAVVRLRRREAAGQARAQSDPGALRVALANPAFWGLSAMFGLCYLGHSVLVTYALVLFAERGAAAGMAVIAASCIGPAQVAGRVALLVNEHRVGNAGATIWAMGAIAVAAGVLWLADAAPLLIFGFAALQGAGIGLTSILRPVLVAQLLGSRGFGTISGAVSVAPILGSAAGPSVGAFLLGRGAEAVYLAGLGVSLVVLMLAVALLRRRSE